VRLGRMSIRVLLSVAIGLLAACQAPAIGPSVDPSALELIGIAQAGPVCPVERVPPDPACADRPVAGALLLVTENGDEVARTTTEADGSFHLRLAPGDYQLVPQPVKGLMGTAAPLEVRLRDGAVPAPLVVAYDTGIR
jgi:hypothetical protein